MHYKTSESTSMSYNQVIHDGDGEITRTPFFRDVLRLPLSFEIWELAAGVSEGGRPAIVDLGVAHGVSLRIVQEGDVIEP